MSINQELVESALDFMEEAIAAQRAEGVKFAVAETRNNYLEFRTPLTPGWEKRLHGQLRKANQKTPLRGVVIMACHKNCQEVLIAAIDSFNKYRQGRHILYDVKDGKVIREPVMELTREEAARLGEILNHAEKTD